MALHIASQGCNNGGQDIFPGPHLYCQNGQANTKLYPDWLWARCKLL